MNRIRFTKAALDELIGSINSLTGIRNNILHQDASPLLTTTQVKDHRDLIQAWADALEIFLTKKLSELAEEAAQSS